MPYTRCLLLFAILLSNLHGNLKDPTVLAITESEPSWNSCKSVNVLSGDFNASEEDLVIEGVEPIRLCRVYTSKNNKSEFGGWEFFPHAKLTLMSAEHKRQRLIYLSEPSGTRVTYKNNGHNAYYLDIEEHGKGVTNCSSVEIGARTNLKNHRIYHEEEKEIKMLCADGTERFYRRAPKQIKLFKTFYLQWERLPNKNVVVYEHEKDGRLRLIKTLNPSQTKLYAWARFHYQKDFSKKKDFEIETSDGRRLSYRFKKHKNDVFYLVNVQSPQKTEENNLYDFFHREGGSLITRRSYSNGRFLEAGYYSKGLNDVGGIEVDIHSEDSRYHRVKMLSASVDSSGNSVLTHRFFYSIRDSSKKERKRTKKKHAYGGTTEVLDAYLNKTVYQFNESSRPISIRRFHNTAHGERLYSAENYTWTNQTDLQCKTLSDETGRPLQARLFFYDDKGNVIEEKLYGNLSGENPTSLVCNPIPEENGVESYKIKYAYSNNLMVRCEEGNGRVTHYSYFNGTDKPAARLTGDGQKILLREFFEYNEDHILIKLIKDNGSSFDKNDLMDVTERTIKVITPKIEGPALGLPHSIEERYLSNNAEVLLKKVVFTYSKEGFVEKEDIYDSKGTLCYSLHKKYDSMGRKVEESNALGQVTKSSYDIHGNKIYQEDANGMRRMHMSYDVSDRLVQTKEETFGGKDRVTTHRYDHKHNKVATIDPFGHETRFVYDAFGNLLETQFPQVLNEHEAPISLKENRSYDSMKRMVSINDGKAAATTTSYNIRGKPILISHPDGTAERFTYYLDGSLKCSIDQVGTQIVYTYDIFERPTSKNILSKGGDVLSSEVFIYNAFHLISKTNADGVLTTYEYDGAGRKISETVHGTNGQESTIFSYDSLGRIHSVQVQDLITFTEYDLLDRPIEERMEDIYGTLFCKTLFSYDAMGNKTHTTRIIGDTQSTEITLFDPYKRPVQHVDPLGNITYISYNDHFINSFGQAVLQKTTTDANGISTIETYDTLERLVSIEKKNPFLIPVSLEELYYDAANNLCKQISTVFSERDNHTRETNWEYGTLNRLLAIIEAVGTKEQKITRFTYTPKGQQEKVIKPNGTILQYSYDPLGRLDRVHSSDGTCSYAFTYNQQNLPILIEDLLSHTTTERSYDARGRLLEEKLGNGLLLQNTYDLRGRRTDLILPDQSAIKYIYESSHLIEIQRHASNGTMLYSHAYTQYNLLGQPLEQELIGNLGTMSFDYDPRGRMVAYHSFHSHQSIDTYDPKGNVLSQTLDGISTTYSYDSLNQLISETGMHSHKYAYDSSHNRLQKDECTYEVNDLNEVISTSEASFVYDLNGNPIKKIEKDIQTLYDYDALDRLISIQTGSRKLLFTYDPFHRRLSKTTLQWHEDRWEKTETLFFLYDGQDEIGAYDDSGKPKQLRVLGSGKGAEIGASISIELDGNIYAPIHDLFGNIIKLISLEKVIAESYQYSVFGEEIIFDASGNKQSNSSLNNPWRFSSKRIDEETGLVYFGKRYYDPFLGRWLTPDPRGFADSLNLYSFVLNDPLGRLDLYGMESQDAAALPHSILTSSLNVIQNVSFSIGWCIDRIGHHFIPFPLLRQLVMFIGNLFMGNFKYHEEPHSHIGVIGNFDISKNVLIILINGILTSSREATGRAMDLSEKLGGVRVYYCYNSSRGFVLDLAECVAGRLGLKMHSDEVLNNWMDNQIELSGPDCTIVALPHSQGGITFYNATSGLSPEQKAHIDVSTMGTAKIIPQTGFKSAINYISSRDGVSMTDVWGYSRAKITGSDHVQFIKGHGVPMFDHGYESSTYQNARENIIRMISKKYGEKID